jgi:hypothetical protein
MHRREETHSSQHFYIWGRMQSGFSCDIEIDNHSHFCNKDSFYEVGSFLDLIICFSKSFYDSILLIISPLTFALLAISDFKSNGSGMLV